MSAPLFNLISVRQFLQKQEKYDFIAFDEAHEGGCTDLTKKALDEVGKRAKDVYATPIVFITGTWIKPELKWNIRPELVLKWSLRDNECLRNEDWEELVKTHNLSAVQKALWQAGGLRHPSKHMDVQQLISNLRRDDALVRSSAAYMKNEPKMRWITLDLDIKTSESSQEGFSMAAVFASYPQNQALTRLVEFIFGIKSGTVWGRGNSSK